MAYSRRIRIYQSDATSLDTTTYASGVVTDALVARVTLAAFGGCLGGVLELKGSVRDAFTLPRDGWIEISYDGTTVDYFGYITERSNLVERNAHEYKLRGAWSRLERVDMTVAALPGNGKLLGADEAGGEATVADVVDWIQDNLITPAAVGILDGGAGFVVSTIAVDSIRILKNANPFALLAQLSYMASSGAAMVVPGVGPDRKLYFKAISTDAGDRQMTMSIGFDVLQGREKPATNKPFNHLAVIGGRAIPQGVNNQGFMPKRTFIHSSASANGQSKLRAFRGIGLYQESDLLRVADGFFSKYAQPDVRVERAFHVLQGAEAPPIPWEGKARYEDAARSPALSKDDYFSRVGFTYGPNSFQYEADFGITDPTNPNPEDPFAVTLVEQIFGPPIDPDLGDPDVTDVTEPPTDEPRPTTDTEVGGGGGGGGADLKRGTVVTFQGPGGAMFDPDAGAQEFISSVAKIYNAGTALSATAVRFHYRHLDNAEPPAQITPDESVAAVRILTNADVEVWTDADKRAAATGADVRAEGKILVGVEVETSAGPPAVKEWYPKEGSAAPLWAECPRIIVPDRSGGGVALGNTLIVGWAAAP